MPPPIKADLRPFLVTVDPLNQNIQTGDCLYSKPNYVEEVVKNLAPKANNGIVCVWQLVERHYVNCDIKTNPFLILPNGEVIPKS